MSRRVDSCVEAIVVSGDNEILNWSSSSAGRPCHPLSVMPGVLTTDGKAGPRMKRYRTGAALERRDAMRLVSRFFAWLFCLRLRNEFDQNFGADRRNSFGPDFPHEVGFPFSGTLCGEVEHRRREVGNTD